MDLLEEPPKKKHSHDIVPIDSQVVDFLWRKQSSSANPSDIKCPDAKCSKPLLVDDYRGLVSLDYMGFGL